MLCFVVLICCFLPLCLPNSSSNTTLCRCFFHLERAIKRYLHTSAYSKPLQYLVKWAWRSVYVAESGVQALKVSVGILCVLNSANLSLLPGGWVTSDTSRMYHFLRVLVQEDDEVFPTVSYEKHARWLTKLICTCIVSSTT
jgi:hypothetical protein